PAPWAPIVPAILPVTVTPVSAPPLIVPLLPTLPIVPPLIVPELGEASSTAFIVPLNEPIDMPVIVPAPCATIVPAMSPVTVTLEIAPAPTNPAAVIEPFTVNELITPDPGAAASSTDVRLPPRLPLIVILADSISNRFRRELKSPESVAT